MADRGEARRGTAWKPPDLWMVHFNVAVYAFAFWMCVPVLPFVSAKLGGDMVSFGYFQTLYAAAQMLGGPVMGWLVDRRGPRFAIQVSHAGALVSYVLLYGCSSLAVLFLSRVATLTMHTMHSAQAYVSSSSDVHGRATALGNLALSYGAGLILGSTAGGVLAGLVGYQEVALIAAVFVVVPMVLNLLWLTPGVIAADSPSSTDRRAAAGALPTDGPLEPRPSVATLPTFAVLSLPAVLDLTVYQLLVGLGIALFQSNFNASAPDRFQLDARELGVLQSYAGVLAVVANIVIVRLLTRYCSDRLIFMLCAAVFAPVYLLLGVCTSRVWLILLFTVLMLGVGTLYTVLTSAFSKSCTEVGTALGISHATRSGCAVLGPLIGTQILVYVGYEGTGYAGFALALCAGLWLLRKSN